MWSMRRSKANFFRIMGVLSGLIAVGKWFDQICNWKNPITTVLIHILFIILVMYPELILPTIFLYLFLIGVWYYRWRPRHPPHMDTRLSHAENAHPDELDEEFDTFPTSRPSDIVRMRYDRLRSIAGRIQTVVGDLATQGERLQSLLSWRDPRATALFVIFCLIAAIVLYVTPFQVVALLTGFYLLRHPRFRHKLPSVPLNFFRRLPARTDCMLWAKQFHLQLLCFWVGWVLFVWVKSVKRCRNKWSLSAFIVWQMLDSVCNLLLKVVDFVDLRLNRCHFMVFLFKAWLYGNQLFFIYNFVGCELAYAEPSPCLIIY